MFFLSIYILGQFFFLICLCFWTNLYLIKFVTMFVYGLFACVAFCRCPVDLHMVRNPWLISHQSSGNFDKMRFKTLSDSQSFLNNFKNAPIMVEMIVRFDTLRSTSILKIFADKDWASLFGNFEDPIEELVKEFYSNAWFTRIELKCRVQGKDFFITLDYLAKILRINCLENVDTSPYDDRLALQEHFRSAWLPFCSLRILLLQEHVYPSIASLWRSWLSSVSVLQKLEWSCLVKDRFPCTLSTRAKVTHLLKGQRKVLLNL